MQVVKSWLDYRMENRKGRKSSPLDDIRPLTWEFDIELLQLLWVVETMVTAEGAAAALLDEVEGGELLTGTEIPAPASHEKKEPTAKGALIGAGGQDRASSAGVPGAI
jgi:hypothetical protein